MMRRLTNDGGNGGGTGGGGEFLIAFVNGPIKFSAEEGVFYARLFHIVDTDADGYIGGTEGAAFIRRARLLNDANREIWRLASGGKSQEKLNKDCWFVAMKLVALVQNTGKCQMQSLYAGESLPLADFKLDSAPDNVLPDEPLQDCRRSFVVGVSTPVVVGSGYTRYTQYVISTKTNSPSFPFPTAQVKRRFSDFEWLHQRLLMQFRGTIIPPLPEKRWTGNMDATFVEERRQALEHFINEVCSHEKLSRTLELQIFLTGSNEGLISGKEILKVPSIAAAYVPTTASVTSLWSSLKDGVFLSSNVQPVEIPNDDAYAKIGEHIDEYEKRIGDVKKCSDVVYAAQRGEGYEMSRFGSYLSTLSAHEKRDDDMRRFAELTGDHFENVSNLCQDQLDKLLAMYVSVIRYQAGKVGAVKVVMNNRESAIQEVQQANASMQRNKERFAAARASSGAAASAMRAEQKMASAEDRMNHAREQVQFIASSLKVESKRMDTGRASDMKDALLALANIELEYHTQARMAWENLLPSLQVSDIDIQDSELKARKRVSYRRPGEKNEGVGQIIGLL
ncbi:hypothetical protein Poli38472_005593 [Pythium oligandrum]|uniref:PX domain-containing protein n=1 Tax=Pythium oligandrum TaxID=41045 RepID=A0A8K1CHT5_PYTOL|nr:hypothetical protein Poli38472_005593 [Pythium oligandrum]|eukprot:TMW62975.1 hypothetical protein Poli38472_005593 [Pythium oligandrum]